MVDKESPEPVWRQVAEYARGQIRSGAWEVGRKVPRSEVKLAEELGVARATVRQAYQLLASEGLLRAVPSRGYWVERAPE